MSSNLQTNIVIQTKYEGDAELKKADEGLRSLVRTGDLLGISMRDARHIATATFLGIDAGANAAGGALDEATKKSLNMAKGIAEVGIAFSYLGPIGGIITAISFAMGAMTAQSPKVAALNNELKNMTEADNAVNGIRELFNVTKDEADEMLTAAKSSEGFANSLKGVVEQAERAKDPLTGVKDVLSGIADYFGQIKKNAPSGEEMFFGSKEQAAALGVVIPETKELTDVSKESAPALLAQAKAINELNDKIKFLKTNLPQAATEMTRFGQAMKDMQAQHDKAIASFKYDEIKAGKDYNDALVKAKQDADESIEKEEASLQKRLKAIDAESLKSLQAIEHDRSRLITDTAKQIADIEFKRIKDIATLDAETGRSIRRASTEQAVRGIQEEALIKRVALEDAANEEKKKALERKAERLEEFTYQSTLQKQNFEQQRALAREESEARKAEIAEQTGKQNDAAKKVLAETLAAIGIKRRTEDEDYAAKKTKEETEHRTRMSNLLIFKTEAEKDIAAERALRGTVWTKYLSDLDSAIAKQNELAGMPMQWNQITGQGNYATRGYAGGTEGWLTVPPGYSSDSYRIGLSSGERFAVQPSGGGSNTFGNIVFNISGARDPRMIGDEIERRLRRIMQGEIGRY